MRTIPIHSDICIRVNANYSEPIQKKFCNEIKFSIRSIQTEFSIRINPNESEVVMIRIKKISFGFIRIVASD